MSEAPTSNIETMERPDHRTVALVQEGLLDPNNMRGSNLGLKSTLFSLRELGYETVVVSLWAEGVDEQSLKKTFQADRFVQIKASNADIEEFGFSKPAGVRFAGDGTRKAILTAAPDFVVLWGTDAIAAGRGLPLFSIGVLGVPEYSTLWHRLLFDIMSCDVSWLEAVTKAKQMLHYYRMSRRNLKKLKKSVDILIAPDFNNANTHSNIARKMTRFFPSLCGMDEKPENWVQPKTPQITFINAPGSHSQASFVYMKSNMLKYFHILKGVDVTLKFIGMPTLPRFIKLPENIQDKIIIQGYTLPIEPELWNSIALVMCSPLKFGSSMRVKSAMACGAVPIIHPNVCNGLPELKHGTNCLVAYNGREYFEHIKTLINNPELQQSLSMNAIKTIKEDFSQERLINFWSRIFKDVAE